MTAAKTRGGYLRPAVHLAAELDLSFTVLTDEEGTAACRYGLDEGALGTTAAATFLVDRWGTLRHVDVALLPAAVFSAAGLIRALGRLRDQAPMFQPGR